MNEMNKIQKIAESIKRHREIEDQNAGYSNKAIGRFDIKIKENKLTIWLTQSPNVGGYKVVRDHDGIPIAYLEGPPTTYKKDGPCVDKNTNLGGILIMHHSGTHDYVTDGKNHQIELFNKAAYKPSHSGQANDLSIRFADDPNEYRFKSLDLLFEKIAGEISEIAEIEGALQVAEDAAEIENLNYSLEARRKQLTELKNDLHEFIRANAALRSQPILDPVQEEIKRSNIFNKTLVINGGPGTGKTTTLIQRIKYLTSPTIEEMKPDLTESQRRILFEQQNSWIFFSPSELLRLFLQQNMTSEGLLATNNNTQIWEDFRNTAFRRYGLFNAAKRKPFLDLRVDKVFFAKRDTLARDLFDAFRKYYIDKHISLFNKVREIECKNFGWKNTGLSVQKYLADKNNIASIQELIKLYVNLNQLYRKESEDIISSYRNLLKSTASEFQHRFNSENRNKLYELLKEAYDKRTITEEDEADEENEELDELDGIDADDVSQFDFELELNQKIRSICRNVSLRAYERNTKLSKIQQQIIEIVPDLKSHSNYDSLGQGALFQKQFNKLTSGPIVNVVNGYANVFREFRKSDAYRPFLSEEGVANLDRSLSETNAKNRRVHKQEQDFILAFLNRLIADLYKVDRKLYQQTDNQLVGAFRDNCKAVIGIDEATDFSTLEIMAMRSFANPEIHSVTLSGDLMQRMTDSGIADWKHLNSIIRDIEIRDLTTSYRQSPTLLELAQTIYRCGTGFEPAYKSFTDKSEKEPSPLYYYNQSEEEKIRWIGDRIVEIYRVYGNQIPSIAVFLNGDIESFSKKLGEYDPLADSGINVKACNNGEVLGNPNTVRVFSPRFIKGLEFETVFFHNIDQLSGYEGLPDIVLKTLYVGLSRASLYLGVTSNSQRPAELEPIMALFSQTKNWKH
jgi:hypothetical protein